MKHQQFLRKIIKEVIIPFSLFLLVMGMALMFITRANAQNSVFDELKSIGDQSKLPSYETNAHSQSSYASGASNITSVIFYAIDFAKYIMGTIAIVTIIISGIRLVTGGKQIDQVAEKQKEHLKYAIIGLLVIIVADQFIKQVFFGDSGEIFDSQSQLQSAAQVGSDKIRGIYSAYSYFAGALAILMIVVSGFRMVTSGGNEEVETKSKKTIMYAVLGLVLLGLSEFVVKDVIFPKQGAVLTDFEKTKKLVITMTNFISGFISTLAAVMYIYGGYLYVTAFGNEEGTSKAKKVLIGATAGLLIAMAAFAIVNTTVRLEPVSGNQQAGSTSPANLPTNPNF